MGLMDFGSHAIGMNWNEYVSGQSHDRQQGVANEAGGEDGTQF